ncbi:hypothetical protein V2J09_010949 [Rumex salicifolius]
MAKFTPEEINYLKAGGNERAKEIYFKEVDLHRVPDNSNVDKLRDFIKHAYVDRRYTGEKIVARPSIVKMDNGEEPYDNRRRDSSQGNQQINVIRRSAIGTGIVNNWRREDRFSNGKRPEGDPKVEAKSPDTKKDVNVSRNPAIRPITDLLGEDSISLHVTEPPRTSSDKMPDGSSRVRQISVSSKSVGSSNGSPTEVKIEPSLIDFDAEYEPQPLPESTSADNSDNWDFMDSAPRIKGIQPPHNSSPLDSVLTSMLPPNVATGQLSSMQQQQQTSQASSELVVVQNVDIKSSGRKELPADIFTEMYAPQPVHAPVWHTGLAPGISYSVQYNTAVAVPNFPQPTKSMNPFDLGCGSSPGQAPEFPPMTSIQNALPNISNPSGSIHTSSLGMTTPSWLPSQPQASPYHLGAPQLTPSFGDGATLQGAYKAQQLFSNLSQRPQGVNVFAGSMPTVTSNASSNPFG